MTDCVIHGPDCPAQRIVTEGMDSPEYAASYKASQEHDRALPWVGCPDSDQHCDYCGDSGCEMADDAGAEPGIDHSTHDYRACADDYHASEPTNPDAEEATR